MSELIERLRRAADWGEDQFDVLSPQDAAQVVKALEAANALAIQMMAFYIAWDGEPEDVLDIRGAITEYHRAMGVMP